MTLSNREKLLCGAIVLAPFTELRFSFIGFSEVLILLTFCSLFWGNVKVNNVPKFPFFNVWFVFILFSLLGFIYNVGFLNHSSGSLMGAVFDFSAYLLILLTCFTLEVLVDNKRVSPHKLLRMTFISAGLILSVLYGLSFTTASLGPFQITYGGGKFAPFVDNIHQVAMFIAPLPFLGAYLLKTETSQQRTLIMVLTALLIAMIFATTATKPIWGFWIGVGILLIFKVRTFPVLIQLCLGAILIFGVAIYFNQYNLLNQLRETFVENDLNGVRQQVYSFALAQIFTSPIIGLGPGPHISLHGGDPGDAHQTFLTIFIQGGGLSVLAFLLFFFSLFKTLLKNPYFLAASCPILIYMLGGDVMRKTVVWLLLLLFYYHTMQSPKYSNKDNKGCVRY